jgi:hypothetical protein
MTTVFYGKSYNWAFIRGELNQGMRHSWTNNHAFCFKASAWERGYSQFYIVTAIGKLLLKICTMLGKTILFHFIYLVWRMNFYFILGVKILPKCCPQSQNSCSYALPHASPCWCTMFPITKLFHLIQLHCLWIYPPFGDFSLLRPKRVKILNIGQVKKKVKSYESKEST